MQQRGLGRLCEVGPDSDNAIVHMKVPNLQSSMHGYMSSTCYLKENNIPTTRENGNHAQHRHVGAEKGDGEPISKGSSAAQEYRRPGSRAEKL